MSPRPLFATITLVLLTAVDLTARAGSAPAVSTPPATQAAVDSRGVAVVELFTSEGCSSCPPAERVASRLARRARTAGAPVYVIAFHVDYWDRLGWPDRFATAAFTERQQRYARAMSSNRVYTPQMIVNGRAAFVGSDSRRASIEIDKARDLAAPVTLTMTRPRRTVDVVSLGVTVDTKADREHLVLNVAIIENGLASDVTKGENAGRRLEHDGVVRAFRTIPLAEITGDEITVPIPHNVVTGRAACVLYVQDARTMQVLGATGRRFSPST